MTDIAIYMSTKHRECDDKFTLAESAAAGGDWDNADVLWPDFVKELLLHLEAEESILFPEFENATGMTSGPTTVMKMEHQQIKALINNLTKALESRDKETYLGESETLMVLMQQHNMKEEQILYPMTAQALPNTGSVVIELQKLYND